MIQSIKNCCHFPSLCLPKHKFQGESENEFISFFQFHFDLCRLWVNSLFWVDESAKESAKLTIRQFQCVGIFYAQTARIIIAAACCFI